MRGAVQVEIAHLKRAALFPVTLILAGTVLLLAGGCDSDGGTPSANPKKSPDEIAEGLRAQTVEFCGDCHAFPPPDTFPRNAWPREVAQGFKFYVESGRTDLIPPPAHEVLKFYQHFAPRELQLPRTDRSPTAAPVSFRAATIRNPGIPLDGKTPGVSHLQPVDLDNDGTMQFVTCDMMNGDVLILDPVRPDAGIRLIASLDYPAHSEPCDLDSDGLTDLVVADLGVPNTSDDREGRVIWLRRTVASPPQFETIVLADSLGRVADVRPADVDEDGDEDLIVAEFGYNKSGSILLLTNDRNESGRPEFSTRVLDDRHGTIHVPPVDLNKDGHIDFVALISQEYETIVAFLNDGEGNFTRETVFNGENPAFGSSGIEMVDLDQDGDLDVLYTNGDAFDAFHFQPMHGIQWLENTGNFPFATRRLTDMPGVHRATAADLDGDGDLDIAAAAMLPDNLTAGLSPGDVDSLIWLEQSAPGRFVRHRIEADSCNYANLVVQDVDADGDIDVCVGHFQKPTQHTVPYLKLFLNE